MLYLVRSTVRMPISVDKEVWDDLLAIEHEIGLELYRNGTIRHLWTVTARYEAVVIYDVESPEELHRIIRSLPLLPYIDYTVESLVPHFYDEMLAAREAQSAAPDQ